MKHKILFILFLLIFSFNANAQFFLHYANNFELGNTHYSVYIISDFTDKENIKVNFTFFPIFCTDTQVKKLDKLDILVKATTYEYDMYKEGSACVTGGLIFKPTDVKFLKNNNLTDTNFIDFKEAHIAYGYDNIDLHKKDFDRIDRRFMRFDKFRNYKRNSGYDYSFLTKQEIDNFVKIHSGQGEILTSTNNPRLMNALQDDEIPYDNFYLNDIKLKSPKKLYLYSLFENFKQDLLGEYDIQDYSLSEQDNNYDNYSRNEFELKRKENAFSNYKKNLITKIGTYDIHYIDISIKIGEYDFENKRFDLFSGANFSSGRSGVCNKITFLNTEKARYLYLDENSAEKFISSLDASRKMKMRLYFIFVPYGITEDLNAISIYSVFYKNCPSEGSRISLTNATFSNIDSLNLSKAINLIDSSISFNYNSYMPNANESYDKIIGWSYTETNCQFAFFWVYSKIHNITATDKEWEFNLYTNYPISVSTGYIVKIKLKNGTERELVVSNIINSLSNCVSFKCKIKKEIIDEIKINGVSGIDFQTSGYPRYDVPLKETGTNKNFTYPLINISKDVITTIFNNNYITDFLNK